MAFVRKNGANVAIVVVGPTSRSVLRFGAKPIASGRLICRDDHIIALADSNEDPRSIIRNDWHKVCGDDSHGVAVERELEVAIDTGVDESQSMFLTRSQGGTRIRATRSGSHGAIDQAVVGSRRKRVAMHGQERSRPDCRIVPIRDCQRSEIFIVVRSSRSVDDDGAKNTIAVLGRKMRVIPARAILCGSKSICLLAARHDRTLCEPWHTILCVIVVHSHPMEVDGSSVVFQLILYRHGNGVTPVGVYRGTWILSIDSIDQTLVSIGCECGIGDSQFVRHRAPRHWPRLIKVGVDVEALAPAAA